MMKIAVGCPIRSRAWIFQEYVEHVRAAFDVVGIKPFWTFAIGVGPRGDDDGTRRIVTDLYKDEPGVWTEITEPDIPDKRFWSAERYVQMASYRNRLLEVVRAAQPDYFLSLDSDMLLHPAALTCMLETIQAGHECRGPYAAVGGKSFLSETSEHITTYADLAQGSGLRRMNAEGVFPVQILMAIKLMSPAAYNIDYEAHMFGEDTGWSLNCQKAGLVLGWDGRVCSKHIMKRADLDKVDARVGW